VQPMTDPDCIFCKIIAGELPAQIVAEDERTIVHGHQPGHPRARAGRAAPARRGPARDRRPRISTAVALAAQRLARRIRDRLHADGVNLINSCEPAAWQTVFHFHIHVIPRYEGDPLRLPWARRRGSAEEIAAAAAELR
jgi:histidine triad (HIT) family protein